MLDARFSHLYFCQSLYTLQRGLPWIADLLVTTVTVKDFLSFTVLRSVRHPSPNTNP